MALAVFLSDSEKLFCPNFGGLLSDIFNSYLYTLVDQFQKLVFYVRVLSAWLEGLKELLILSLSNYFESESNRGS